MGSSTIVVAGTVRDDPVELPLVDSDHVTQTLPWVGVLAQREPATWSRL